MNSLLPPAAAANVLSDRHVGLGDCDAELEIE